MEEVEGDNDDEEDDGDDGEEEEVEVVPELDAVNAFAPRFDRAAASVSGGLTLTNVSPFRIHPVYTLVNTIGMAPRDRSCVTLNASAMSGSFDGSPPIDLWIRSLLL